VYRAPKLGSAGVSEAPRSRLPSTVGLQFGGLRLVKKEASHVASLIQHPSEQADRELSGFFDRPGREEILEELLRWDDGAVRFWAIEAAEKLYSRGKYIRVLERAARDPDHAVSADAISRLLDVAPERVQRMTRSITSKLSSNIPSGEKVFVLWTLAKLQARQSIPEIEALRAHEPEWTKLARVADVVLTYLNKGERAILDAIENHTDHARMEELCTLAWFVTAGPAARSALEKCAESAPDEDCRRECAYGLGRSGEVR